MSYFEDLVSGFPAFVHAEIQRTWRIFSGSDSSRRVLVQMLQHVPSATGS